MKGIIKRPIIFFGTSEFSVPFLESLVKNNWPVKLVVTQPEQPAGRHRELRPPPIKIIAEKLRLKIIQPPSLKNIINPNSKFQIPNSIYIVCAYGKLIPADILQIPKYGAINIHPSLLPKYRGPSPIQTALLNGDKETGATVMLLDEEMDHGPILAREKIEIKPEEIYPELSERLARVGAALLLKTLPDWLANKIKPQPQDHAKATFTKLLTREDGKIDWQKPAQTIFNQWRAFLPWPGVYAEQKSRIKLIKLKLSDLKAESKSNPGQFIKIGQKNLGVICGDKKILLIAELQPEGKKMMTAEEFLNGYPL